MRSITLFTTAAFSAFSAFSTVHASECEKTGQISGRIITVNASETLEYGVTRISIERKGKLFYAGQGVVIGQVVGKQDNGLPILNQTVYLSDGSRIRTEGNLIEHMIPTGKLENGVPCEFTVLERITRAEATRKLEKLDDDGHNVEARGVASVCSDNNRNDFVLSGTVCFD